MLIEGLEKLLPDCQSGDKFRFRKRLAAQREKKQGTDQAKVLNQLAREIRQSVNACHVRDLAIPREICYPVELPVSENASKLVQLVRDHQVLRLKGRLWLSGKALPLQIQMVGPRLNSWFEASPPTAWTPDSGCGADLVVLSLQPDAADAIRSSLQRLMQATPATANPAATTPRA